MCGIFGRLGQNHRITAEQAASAQVLMNHRGPDDRGFESGDGYDLGFNRLAILDLTETGHQPMWDSSNRYCIVFNGEIFNYKELRETHLTDADMKGTSDTEVLLNLLIQKGTRAVPLLNGMFAFCWVDTYTGEFILARDRFGIKPLYYTIWEGDLFFASELTALEAICKRPYTTSKSAIYDYLGSGYISGPQSIFNNVYRFPPAHAGYGNLKEPSELTRQEYWKLTLTEDYKGSYEDALDELDGLLNDAVRIRLRSDVPLGVFLSGGIDSGLVAAIASKHQKIDCFTISFPGSSRDESSLAKKTADHIGASWHPIEVGGLEQIDLGKMTLAYDEPFADSSSLPSYAICESASKYATVFLTGDAGDEAFAGYARYIKRLRHEGLINKMAPVARIPGIGTFVPAKHKSKLDRLKATRQLSDPYYDGIPDSWLWRKLMSRNHFNAFLDFHKKKAYDFYRYDNITSNQQYFDYRFYLPDDILVKMDRASMAHSLEVRSPFLDYRIHELAAKLPRHWLIDDKTGKKILRDLSRRYLPGEIVSAKKSGFGIPIQDWTRDKTFLSKLKNPDVTESDLSDIIDFDKLSVLLDKHHSQKVNVGTQLWWISMFRNWEDLNKINL